MKIYYVEWKTLENNTYVQGATSWLFNNLPLDGTQATYAANGRYFANKDKAQKFCDRLNDAIKLLQQFGPSASLQELEVEE